MANALRIERLEAQVKSDLSLFLLKDVSDPRLKVVTITAVKLTDDLSLARIMCDTIKREKTGELVDLLNKNAGLFRSHLAEKLQLRRAPELRFEPDKSIDEAIKIEQLLKQVKK